MGTQKLDRGTAAETADVFVPRVDTYLTIDLPGERTRALVKRVVDTDTVIVELTSQPMSKTHQYRVRDLIPVRRGHPGEMAAPGSPEIWVAVEMRATLPAEFQAPPPPIKKTPIKETKHAVEPRTKPKRHQPKHRRDDARRPSAKPGGRGGPAQRKGAPAVAGRGGRTGARAEPGPRGR